MAPEDDTIKDLETERKRLIFRSWHRGTREMDLILGGFANAHVPGFSEEELGQYAEVLKVSDPDLYDWITGKTNPPPNALSPVLEKLLRSSSF